MTAQGVKERKLNFNAAKSKVIVSWREPVRRDMWKLGEESISEGRQKRLSMGEANEYKYLGVWIRLRGKIFGAYLSQQLQKVIRVGGILRNISRGGINPSKCAKEGWEKVGLVMTNMARR